MTEREKMDAGELYDPNDPALVAGRVKARALCSRLNARLEVTPDENRELFRELLGSGSESVIIQPPFFCDYGDNIHLGEKVFFNFNCVVLDVCPVHIGSFTMFGSAVQVMTPLHPVDAMERRGKEYGAPVRIGSDVWVGSGAIILPGVTIGDRTIIGAGSVVTRDIPSDVLAVGNPCRVIRQLAPGERPTP